MTALRLRLSTREGDSTESIPLDSSPSLRETSNPQVPEPSSATRRKVIASSFIGNFVEWFDYGVYGYFATTIAAVFFPHSSGREAMLFTYGIFGFAFFVRPLGAIFWGHFGDTKSRKKALGISILLMCTATFCIGLLPGWATIGLAAPIILFILRVIQGFSASGEYAGASAFLTEYAPEGKRGRYAAVVPTSTAGGLLLGSLLAALLTGVLDTDSLQAWGWRIPFLIAGPLGLVGLFIRMHLEDSPEYKKMADVVDREESVPLVKVFRERRALVVTLCAATLNAIGFYVLLSYMPTYLSNELGQDATESLIASSVTLFAYIFMVQLAGQLSDKIGRKPTLLLACALFVLLTVFSFELLNGASLVTVIVIELVMGMCLALNDGVLPSFLSEQFSTEVRFTGFALTFNVANAIFGGTAAYVATWLIGVTGMTIAPAFYLMAAAVVTAVAVLAARETKSEPLAHSAQDIYGR